MLYVFIVQRKQFKISINEPRHTQKEIFIFIFKLYIIRNYHYIYLKSFDYFRKCSWNILLVIYKKFSHKRSKDDQFSQEIDILYVQWTWVGRELGNLWKKLEGKDHNLKNKKNRKLLFNFCTISCNNKLRMMIWYS